MSNELSILGFGQCGSKVAVEISASFNPTALLTEGTPVHAKLTFVRRRFRAAPPDDRTNSPAFYIADLNTSNDVYVYFRKAQAIRENLHQIEGLSSPAEILSKINRNSSEALCCLKRLICQ